MPSTRKALGCLAALLTLGIVATAQAEDPTIVYETTLEGYYLPTGREITVDADGNAYVIGSAYEDEHSLDVLVLKVSPEGNVLWTQYIVGESHNYAEDMVLDDESNLWVVGWTDSDNYPTTPGALNESPLGFRNIFLTQFASADGSILYSTFLGGTYTSEGHAITRDAMGNLIIGGSTRSQDFPTTPDAYQSGPTASGYVKDVILMKLSPGGDEVLYSTYFGGLKKDEVQAIRVDIDGNLVLAGFTESLDFPLASPIESMPRDIFVAKFSQDASALLFSTYLGGTDVNRLWDMELDGDGFVYLAGSTQSPDFPVTAGVVQSEFAGEINGCGPGGSFGTYNCDDGFVTKLSTSGGGLVYSTYLGGARVDEIHGLALSGDGSVRVTGESGSSDFPGSDANDLFFVSRLSDEGATLDYTVRRYASYGGGFGITSGETNEIYVTGVVEFPAEVYVAKLREQGKGQAPSSAPDAPFDGTRMLSLASPNPFHGATQVSYSIPGDEAASVSLGVFDASGRLVRSLVDAQQTAGTHTVTWDGRDQIGSAVPGGIYFYVLDAVGQREAGRVLLVR